MNSILIGIAGKARSGKDTFAEMLAEELYNIGKQKFILMAYANEIKLRLQRDFDLSYDQLWGNAKEVSDDRYYNEACSRSWTPREIMQAYGQFHRSIDPNFWVKSVFNRIDDNGYKHVMITDVRHPNEADPIVAANGFIIRVVSDRVAMEDVHGKSHISETAMDSYENVTFDVDNNSTLEDLRKLAASTAKLIYNMKMA